MIHLSPFHKYLIIYCWCEYKMEIYLYINHFQMWWCDHQWCDYYHIDSISYLCKQIYALYSPAHSLSNILHSRLSKQTLVMTRLPSTNWYPTQHLYTTNVAVSPFIVSANLTCGGGEQPVAKSSSLQIHKYSLNIIDYLDWVDEINLERQNVFCHLQRP